MTVNLSPILGAVVGLQSVAVVKHSAKLLDKKMTPKKMTKNAVGTMVGLSLMSPTAKLVNELN